MMQFIGLLSQSGQSQVEAAGFQAPSDRTGTSEGDTSGSGFLSLLRGAQTEQSAESTVAAVAVPGDSSTDSQDATDQSLALALHVAGALLGDQPPTPLIGLEEGTTPETIYEDGTSADPLSQVMQGLVSIAANGEATASQIAQAASGFSATVHELSAGRSDALPHGEDGFFISNPETGSKGYEFTLGDSSVQADKGSVSEGQEQRESPVPLPTGSGQEDRRVDLDRQVIQKPQAPPVLQDADTSLREDVVTAERHVAADPVFRLPGTGAEQPHEDASVIKKDPAPAVAAEQRQGEGSRGLTHLADAEWQVTLHVEQRGRQDASSFEQEFSSFSRHQPEVQTGSASIEVHGQSFAIAAAAQATAPPDNAAPTPPPTVVQAGPLERETSHIPAAQSVQFELPNADLGQLRVRVVLSDQTVHTHMVTDRADVGRLLVDRQEHLGAQLSTAGLDLGQLRVQVDRQGSHQQGSEWSAYRQGERFHQQSGQRHAEPQSPLESPARQRAGVLSLFA